LLQQSAGSIFVLVMQKLTISVWLVLVFAGCQTAPSVPFAQAGDPVLRSGSVVFAGIDGELYATTGADTIVQLTHSTAAGRSQVVHSAYGWAGSSIVYATQEINSSGGITGTIYTVVPGETPRSLLRRPSFAPFFLYPTPDGSRVGYLGSETNVSGLLMGSITVEGRDEILHGRGQPFYAAWSPDSSTLMTHVGLPFGPSGSTMRLQSVDRMLRGETPGSPLALSAAGFQAPAFSPDGQSIAVALREGNSKFVAVVRTATNEVRSIAPLAGSAALGWSPGGDRLAYIDGQNTGPGGIVGRLWIANTEDREIQLVSERAGAFFWAPDGSKIVFLEPNLVGADTGAVLLYRVGLYRTFDGESHIIAVMQPAEAFVQQVIPFFDQYLQAYTIWSPDSRLVVLNSTAIDGTPVIHLVDTEMQRSGGQFNVAYRTAAGPEAATGLLPEDGIASRVLGFGTVPFFSHTGGVNRDGSVFSSPELVRPEIDS
jgi:WD40 repeat protein